MDQMIDNLSSPMWWVTVVAGTILLHIIAIRFDAAIPKAFQVILKRRFRISKQRREASEARVTIMREMPETVQYFVHQANFNHHQATFWLITTLTMVFVVVGYLDPLTYHSLLKSALLAGIYMLLALSLLLTLSAHERAFEIGQDVHTALMTPVSKSSGDEKDGQA